MFAKVMPKAILDFAYAHHWGITIRDTILYLIELSDAMINNDRETSSELLSLDMCKAKCI